MIMLPNYFYGRRKSKSIYTNLLPKKKTEHFALYESIIPKQF